MLRWRSGVRALTKGRKGGGRLIGIFVDDLLPAGAGRRDSAAGIAIAFSSSSSSSSSSSFSSSIFSSPSCSSASSSSAIPSPSLRLSSFLPAVFRRSCSCQRRFQSSSCTDASSSGALAIAAADRSFSPVSSSSISGSGASSLCASIDSGYVLGRQHLNGDRILLHHRHRQFSQSRFLSSVAREDKEDGAPTSPSPSSESSVPESGNAGNVGAEVRDESTSSFWRTWIEKKLKDSRSSTTASSSSSSSSSMRLSVGPVQPTTSTSWGPGNGVGDTRGGPSISNSGSCSNGQDATLQIERDMRFPMTDRGDSLGIAKRGQEEEGGKLNASAPWSTSSLREKDLRPLRNPDSSEDGRQDGFWKMPAEKMGVDEFVHDVFDGQILSQMTSAPRFQQPRSDGASSLMSHSSGDGSRSSRRADNNASLRYRRSRPGSASSGPMLGRQNEVGDGDFEEDGEEGESDELDEFDRDIELMDMDEHNIATLSVIPRQMFDLDEQYQFRPDRKFFPGQMYENEDVDVSIPPSHRPSLAPRDVSKFTEKQVLANADFRNVRFLQQFISESGRLLPRRHFKLRAKVQRKVVREIKTSRALGLMPFQILDGPRFRFRKFGHEGD